MNTTQEHHSGSTGGEYQDGEVLGVEANRRLIQWNAESKEPYTGCETVEEFGIHNLRPHELTRVGVTPEQYVQALAARQAKTGAEHTNAEKAIAFVKYVAGLKKWGEPNEDGEPFEPSDGVDDSHTCLMDLIDEARALGFEQ